MESTQNYLHERSGTLGRTWFDTKNPKSHMILTPPRRIQMTDSNSFTFIPIFTIQRSPKNPAYTFLIMAVEYCLWVWYGIVWHATDLGAEISWIFIMLGLVVNPEKKRTIQEDLGVFVMQKELNQLLVGRGNEERN
ncbi:unnamed protein product [Fraxinus pennsylvanica]|uniref:Uncharacterized protein n=1 Tax=Fraxinus pennsylvanica TaxID=56036 RepID=A0AAD1ZHG4_9LAMI|nr:unnamed protein product [Fraxinus pennsylvanica]